MNNEESESALQHCILLDRGLSGTAAGSYLGYYTNVHWLRTLYATDFPANGTQGQDTIYIEGVGTEDGMGDSTYSMGTGRGDTGVVRKTDKAVAALASAIKNYFAKPSESGIGTIKELQFDILDSAGAQRRRGTSPTGYLARTTRLLRRLTPD